MSIPLPTRSSVSQGHIPSSGETRLCVYTVHACHMYLLDKRPCKRAVRTWTHKFVSLSRCAQDIIPTTDTEKDALLEAGLGEKKIVVENVDCSGEEFRELLDAAFPKLKFQSF